MAPAAPVILCTGANRGLGYAILQVLLQRQPSWTYILGSRDEAAGEKAAAELRQADAAANIHALQLDVTNDDHIDKAVKWVEAQFGRLDVLINNAGILNPPNWETLGQRELFAKTLDVNLTSTAVMTSRMLPLLHRSSDPKVINITSGISSMTYITTRPVARSPVYGSSKTGLNGLTVQMQTLEFDRVKSEAAAKKGGDAVASAPDPARTAASWGRSGVAEPPKAGSPMIRFYVVQPGVTKTSFTRHTFGRDPIESAEVAVHLAVDQEGKYPGGTYWEFENNEMTQVPW